MCVCVRACACAYALCLVCVWCVVCVCGMCAFVCVCVSVYVLSRLCPLNPVIYCLVLPPPNMINFIYLAYIFYHSLAYI